MKYRKEKENQPVTFTVIVSDQHRMVRKRKTYQLQYLTPKMTRRKMRKRKTYQLQSVTPKMTRRKENLPVAIFDSYNDQEKDEEKEN